MKTTVGNIANIQSGFFLRTQAEGEIVYLQAKHFDENGDIKQGSLVPDLMEGVQERHVLRKNDLLFVAKGTRIFASIYKNEFGPCVASSTFFIVRINNNAVLPEYLALILNQSQNRAYFKNHFSGSTIPSIPKNILADFEISIPHIEKQKQLIQLFELHKKASKLRLKLEEKRQEYISKVIISSSNS